MKDADALRAEVARHQKRARAMPLLQLSSRLEYDYWSAGPGQPASVPVLNELVEVLEEACGYLEPGSFVRGQAAGQLGTALATRSTVHFGPEQDGHRAVPLLEESLTFPALPHMLQVRNRYQLATLLLTRAMRGLQDPAAAMQLLLPGATSPGAADADRAVALLREVRDGPVVGTHISEMTEVMLEMAEAMQGLLGGRDRPGGGPAGLDFGRITEAFGRIGELQKRMAARPPGAGFGYVPNVFDFTADDLAAQPPQDRPVMVVDIPAPDDEAGPDPAPAAVRAGAAQIRADLAALVPSPAAYLRLLADEADPDADTVDELVALGACLVEAPDATPADHLPLAVGRCLRGATGGDGWGEPDGAGGADDLKAAATHLLAGAEALPAQPDDELTVALRLADLLDRRAPEHDAGARLVELSGLVTALRAAGADALLVTPGDATPVLATATGRLVAGPAADLPPRVVVAGDAPVPAGTVVSRVRTAARLVTLAARARRPVAEAAVFVADPRGDRPAAGGDALVLRRLFFPRSTGLGRTVESCEGAGSPDDVTARLDASLLHLGCGVTADGDLELAGGAVLPVAAIAAGPPAGTGGLAVLPTPAPGCPGTAALTDALLTSRCREVIAFREPVADAVASLLYFLLYAELVDERRDPADAVAAVRCWLADPDRTVPDHLPPWYATPPAGTDLAELAERDVLVHHGV